MPKPIMLTDEVIEQMKAEFEDHLRKAKLSDGKLTYTKNFSYKDDDAKVSVMFTPLAYVKMISLLQHCNDEVAWHGFVDRKSEDLFLITDIVVYPQEVTGATVNTDQEGYQQWIMEIDDERFNSLRMQGHSHVNMACSPSSTDLNHQEQILAQLSGDAYYIFMIWNKRLDHNIKVYDFATNTLYEDKDVEVGVVDEGFDMDSFIEDIDSLVKKKTYTAATSTKTSEKGSGKSGKSGDSKKGKSSTLSGQYPGLYGGYYGGNPYYGGQQTDYDEMIFGGRRG